MKTIFFIFFINFSVLGCIYSQNNKHTPERNPIELSMDKNAESLLSDPTINAISMGVYKDGEIYINHYGELDKGQGNTPTDETIYEIASVSKTFAGTLVAQAELDGKLNLEDDIRKYLKEDFSNLEYEGNPIRIKHLITHTSRLPKFLPITINKLFENPNDSLAFKIYQIEKDYNRDKFIIDLQSITIDTIPGTKFDYSNADTELAAYILENIYKKPYYQLIREEICNKIGMTSTGTVIPDDLKINLTNGYTVNDVLAPNMAHQLWGAGGGIMSTIPDMIKYIKFQLDNNNETAVKSHQVVYENGEEKIGYYWPISNDENNGTYFSHHGGAFGTQNLLFVIPKKNIGVIIFTNQSLPETAGKLYKVMDGILKDL
ncbi:MAG: serine hydrolase domain-containing protein [Aequorivita sp.]|nr:serine hydrolase domain-containing protein [Aequorivita sp.]